MAKEQFTAEESRKFAVLIARAWADPALAEAYESDPAAVLAGSGIMLQGRTAPDLPPKPEDLATTTLKSSADFSSASSISTVTCPCSGCTASCAQPCAASILVGQQDAIMHLAEDPKAREQARAMTAAWGINLTIRS